ncbi:MAG: helix-turn-helix domain-containing protein [Desulfobaccales bacterium]
MKALLDVRKVAELLGVSHYTVRMEIYRKNIACVRVARRILVHPDDLEAYLQARRTKADIGREK